MWIMNHLPFVKKRANQAGEDFLRNLESELTEEFLKILLRAMRLFLIVNPAYRRNIKGFNGRYTFQSSDQSIMVSVIFKNGDMKIREKEITQSDINIIFRNAKALRDYILSPKPDILGALLKQEVVPHGNLNYLYKFAFMAKRLQLIVENKI